MYLPRVEEDPGIEVREWPTWSLSTKNHKVQPLSEHKITSTDFAITKQHWNKFLVDETTCVELWEWRKIIISLQYLEDSLFGLFLKPSVKVVSDCLWLYLSWILPETQFLESTTLLDSYGSLVLKLMQCSRTSNLRYAGGCFSVTPLDEIQFFDQWYLIDVGYSEDQITITIKHMFERNWTTSSNYIN